MSSNLSFIIDLLQADNAKYLVTFNKNWPEARHQNKQAEADLSCIKEKRYLDQSTNFLDSFKYDDPTTCVSLAQKKRNCLCVNMTRK